MTSVVVDAERDKYSMINFEETELRLGLPGGESGVKIGGGGGGKRGFEETASVDLKLNLSSSSAAGDDDLESVSSVLPNSPINKGKEKTVAPSRANNDPAKPPAKAQVVGWPPVRSFRKNIVNQRSSNNEDAEKKFTAAATTTTAAAGGGAFVKVSMDGAPYLRKVDLKLYKSYQELSDALAKMFNTSVGGSHHDEGMSSSSSKLMMGLLNGSDYVPTYQDKDGDWMLLGDVPWKMFVESCKRLRIMKGSEAIGLAPRAVEKCKNRS